MWEFHHFIAITGAPQKCKSEVSAYATSLGLKAIPPDKSLLKWLTKLGSSTGLSIQIGGVVDTEKGRKDSKILALPIVASDEHHTCAHLWPVVGNFDYFGEFVGELSMFTTEPIFYLYHNHTSYGYQVFHKGESTIHILQDTHGYGMEINGESFKPDHKTKSVNFGGKEYSYPYENNPPLFPESVFEMASSVLDSDHIDSIEDWIYASPEIEDLHSYLEDKIKTINRRRERIYSVLGLGIPNFIRWIRKLRK